MLVHFAGMRSGAVDPHLGYAVEATHTQEEKRGLTMTAVCVCV